MNLISTIVGKGLFNRNELIMLLNADRHETELLFDAAFATKLKYVGSKVYFRGLIEFSNICLKNCFYCGIRHSNKNVTRYNLTDEEIINSAMFAYKNNYGSLVLQSGELSSNDFTARVTHLLKKIRKLSNNSLGITLSLGEQTEDVYRQWFEAGAHRYLLRIETSNEKLYKNLHPVNHSFENRLNCLKVLKKTGYQVGTGVMIGLPFQTDANLADDLLFMQHIDVDMVGMGPYIEHKETPLYKYRNKLLDLNDRFAKALKMIAILRLMMKDINIAAATALQAIDPEGREKAIAVGANVVMPNVTPGLFRNNYALYPNKPNATGLIMKDKCNIDACLNMPNSEIGYGEWGDSKHYFKRIKKDYE